MITVLVAPDMIHVSGHANTAPQGADIVCSAVSALTLTLIRGLKEIAHMELLEELQQEILSLTKRYGRMNWQ